ncbi:organomercurial lyase [Phaeobacter gallaeciensis]|nr:organomercurial lyase [Phaeobacter gallaeciensis]
MGYFRKLPFLPKKILLALYRLIADGEPVDKAALALRAGVNEAEVSNVLDSLPPSNIVFDQNGRITGYRGLSLLPSRHRLLSKSVQLYAWCAFDCLFLPELLGQSMEVHSTCPGTGEEIYLLLEPGRVEKVFPETVFVSFVTPQLNDYQDDLRGNFCCHVNFFSSEKAGLDWTQAHGGSVIVGLEGRCCRTSS